MDHSHWYIVASLASAINVALIIYLIKRASDQNKESNSAIKELSKSFAQDIDKAFVKFDKLCLERQASCSLRQDVKTSSMCQKLNQYAVQNDKMWEKLAERREIAWARHEEQMEKIWEAIRIHSHSK